MALINCPECNKEVSDKASACIHCGCPLDDIKQNCSPITAKDLLQKCNGDEVEFKRILMEKYGHDEDLAYIEFWFLENGTNNIITDYTKLDNTPKQVNIPKCPTCQSTNIEKIATIDKIGSVALFGLLATGHVSKTFRCKDCNYKW